jgi:hypothetical protein
MHEQHAAFGIAGSGEQSNDEQHDSEKCRDECGRCVASGSNESSGTEKDEQRREEDGDVCHDDNELNSSC